jgi:hypothetical protein
MIRENLNLTGTTLPDGIAIPDGIELLAGISLSRNLDDERPSHL